MDELTKQWLDTIAYDDYHEERFSKETREIVHVNEYSGNDFQRSYDAILINGCKLVELTEEGRKRK